MTITLTTSTESRAIVPILHDSLMSVAYELPLEELPAGETITLTLLDDVEERTVSYTVLEGLDEVPPTFRDDPFGDVGFEGGRTATGEIAYDLWFSGPAADDDQLVVMYEILHVADGDDVGVVVDLLPGGDRDRIGTELIFTAPEETRCFTAAAIDVGGNRTLLEDELCVELYANGPGPFGCSASRRSASAWLPFALIGGILLVTRRRRH